MPQPTHHILTLPREIRDIIYTHLTHSPTFKWGFRPLAFPLGGHMGVKVTAHNAPLPAVLLSCTQIYDEYRCSEVFRYMRMRVYATQRELIGLPEGCQTYMGRVGDLAGRVEGVDLVVEREGIVGYGEIDEEVWEALGKVVKRGLEMRVWFEGEI